MTVQEIRGVGFCALLNAVGDWALAVALDCAKRHRVRLDIFFFPTSPYEPHSSRGRQGERASLSRRNAIELERRVRLYYDARLGDFLDAGFRLCLGDGDPELRRCLLFRKEYDVLVLPFPSHDCRFGDEPLIDFAESLPCPVVLVGPEKPSELWLNSAGRPLAAHLLPTSTPWTSLPTSTLAPVGC